MNGNSVIVFETGRLLLRQQSPDDLVRLWDFLQDPENIRHYRDAPGTIEEVKRELDWDLGWYLKNNGLGKWAIIHRKTGRLIGLCSLLPWTVDGTEEMEMAYILSPEFRGQGLGTELSQAVLHYGFEKLNLSRIVSLIEPDNLPSRRVVEKIGMKFEKESKDEYGCLLLYSFNKV